MNMTVSKEQAKSTTCGGIGIIGMLVILGLLGLGPCAESCHGCGPTPESVYRSIKCEVPNADH